MVFAFEVITIQACSQKEMTENAFFSRDNHKTASWVIDIEVIGLRQNKGSLQVCNVISSDNKTTLLLLKIYGMKHKDLIESGRELTFHLHFLV